MDRRTFVEMGGLGAAGLVSGMAVPRTIMAGTGSPAEMAWWRDARFGMFIHWGVYSVPAGVWKGDKVRVSPAEWIMYAKNIKKDEYAKLAKEFNPVKFDAPEWAALAKRAGMKYMVITSKHHDGFCMFDAKNTDYNIVDATPFGRDVIAELSGACGDAGVRFGIYYSQLDWRFCVRPYTAHYMPRFKKYFAYMKEHLDQLLTGYGEYGSMFFDGDWMPTWNVKRGKEVEALVRSHQPGVVINDRLGKRTAAHNIAVVLGLAHSLQKPEVGDYATPEQTIPETDPDFDWETCMTMNTSWGYKSFDDNWKPAQDLIRKLADIVSKGGNFLLNVGPTAEGVIPEESVVRLEKVGDWMAKNGEAIYGTDAGPVRGEWGVSTKKEGRLYLHVFEWPDSGLEVYLPDAEVKGAKLLGWPDEKVDYERRGEMLSITKPRKTDPADTVVEVMV